jgi:hypothetical protein
MNEAMVVTAEEEAVLEARLTTIGPVFHMMSIGEAESASWKSASAVPDLEGTAQGGGDRAGSAAYAKDRVVRGVRDADETGIAAYPPRRFR